MSERKNLKTRWLFLSSPWLFVPSLYLIQGIIEGGVLQFAVTMMYKSLNYSNAFIGYISFLQLPTILSFLWAPYVDGWGSKRALSILFLFCLSVGFLSIAGSLYIQSFFTAATLTAFLILSFLLSFLKIASDGYYIRALEARQQALFIGVKTSALRIGMIGAIGILAMAADKINAVANSQIVGWFWMYIFLSGLTVCAAIYNFFFLPSAKEDLPVRFSGRLELLQVFADYLKQQKAGLLIFFILIFRFGQGLLARMTDPFMLDPAFEGGLGMDISSIGMVRSCGGIPFMIIGGLLGGWIVKRWGLQKTFLPLALCMTAPNLGYWAVSVSASETALRFHQFVCRADLFGFVCLEALGYGMGFSAFFYYLHILAQGSHKTSFLAISMALMGLGWYIPFTISGKLQELTSYPTVFILSVVFSIPGLVLIPFLPMPGIVAESDRR